MILTVNADAINRRVFHIGKLSENKVEQIDFNVRHWQERYGEGGAVLIVQRYGDTAGYLVPLIIEDGVASWVISNVDTAKVGKGAAELKYVVGDKVKMGTIFGIICEKSLADSGEVPDEYESWLDTLTTISTQVTTNAQTATAAATAAQTSAASAAASATAAGTAQTAAEVAQGAAEAAQSAAETAQGKAETAQAAAQSALAGMTFVGFSVDADGHVLITNSDLLGTTEFELTENGHMEVTY